MATPTLKERAERYAEVAKNHALSSGATPEKAAEIYKEAYDSTYSQAAASTSMPITDYEPPSIDILDPEGLSKKDHGQKIINITGTNAADAVAKEQINQYINDPEKASLYASAINNSMTDSQKAEVAREISNSIDAKNKINGIKLATNSSDAGGDLSNDIKYIEDALNLKSDAQQGAIKNSLFYSDPSSDGGAQSVWKAKREEDQALYTLLENFESDINDYLYDLEPQSQNLFWCGFFTESDDQKTFYNAPFRIRKVSFPTLELEIEQHPETKTPLFKGAKYNQEVTIDWFEDVYHSVNQYHEDWQARWYNRYYDVLRCGASGKFRRCTLVAYHKVNTNTDSLVEKPVVEPLIAYEIGGMVPTTKTALEYDQANDQNDSNYHVTYKCGRILTRYSDTIAYGFENNELYNGIAGVESANAKAVWKPTGFVEADGGTNTGYEALRIVRSASTHYF